MKVTESDEKNVHKDVVDVDVDVVVKKVSENDKQEEDLSRINKNNTLVEMKKKVITEDHLLLLWNLNYSLTLASCFSSACCGFALFCCAEYLNYSHTLTSCCLLVTD